MREKINNVLSSPDVRSDAPKDSTDKQTDVLPKFEEGAFESKFVDNRCENKSSYDLKTRHGDRSKKKESAILQARDCRYPKLRSERIELCERRIDTHENQPNPATMKRYHFT